MNRIAVALLMSALSLTFVPTEVEAKRLGGGSSSGMRRQAPPPQATPSPTQQAPAKPAAAPAANATPGAAAPAPRRSWMGPIAGLAAGLGLAALASHLGLGAEFGNVLMLVLLGVVALVAVRWAMTRFRAAPGAGTMRYAGAGAAAGAGPSAGMPPTWPSDTPVRQPAHAPLAPAQGGVAAPQSMPAGFDTTAFERAAKVIFVRMQAANDAGNLEDLRQFSTPEMFANFRIDLQDRAGAAQQTDVVQLDARVVEVAEEADLQIVSVRFSGLIREAPDAPAEPFDEVWHLTRPRDGSREWAIAGIGQQSAG